MKLHKWFSSIAALLLFVGCTSTKTAIRPQIGQHPRSFAKQITKTVQVNYLLFLPKDYEKDKRPWPLMVFLHGAGESGDSLELVKRNGPPKIVEEQKDFPFILLSPQCPQGEWRSFEILNLRLDDIQPIALCRSAFDRHRNEQPQRRAKTSARPWTMILKPFS